LARRIAWSGSKCLGTTKHQQSNLAGAWVYKVALCREDRLEMEITAHPQEPWPPCKGALTWLGEKDFLRTPLLPRACVKDSGSQTSFVTVRHHPVVAHPLTSLCKSKTKPCSLSCHGASSFCCQRSTYYVHTLC
jgi:hypothetical protein